MRIHPLAFLAVCLAFCGIWLGWRASGQVGRYADRYLQALVEREQFSGSVSISREGRVLFARGYGYANVEWRVPNTASTRFRIASLTKPVTATLLLKLAQRGVIDVNRSVCEYIDRCPQAWRGVTLHHLLSHTSGIANFTDDPAFHERKRLRTTAVDVIAQVSELPLAFVPGEASSYSNTNYVLLAVVIEKATRKPYETMLREELLAPLGMSGTGVDRFESIVEHHASGYTSNDGTLERADYADPSWSLGAGSLYSTVQDLDKLTSALSDGAVLPPSVLQRMWTPVREDYGYGWSLAMTEHGRAMTHAGRTDGFISCLTHFPDTRLTVVVLANHEIKTHACTIANNLASIGRGEHASVKPERHAIALAPALLQSYVGIYEFDADLTVIVTAEEGKLFARIDGQSARYEMFAESQAEFFFKVFDTDVTFESKGASDIAMRVRRPLRDELVGRRSASEARVLK